MRAQASVSRRAVRALEMKALRARLDRFQAKIDGGEVVDGEEFLEGKRMERLFQRWLRSMEEEAAANEEGSSVEKEVQRWPGWF